LGEEAVGDILDEYEGENVEGIAEDLLQAARDYGCTKPVVVTVIGFNN